MEKAKGEKRSICTRCSRPTPQACICAAIPSTKITLQSQVIVLQHPHELRRKNRSVPILELCIDETNLHLCVGKCMGPQTIVDAAVFDQWMSRTNLPILVFPGDNDNSFVTQHNAGQTSTMNLQDTLRVVQEFRTQQAHVSSSRPDELQGRVILLFLDATWKYGKEMHIKNKRNGHYPNHMIHLALNQDDLPTNFVPGRFNIRTTPAGKKASSWMSTGECVAMVLSRIENNPRIYEEILKPMDAMVQTWNKHKVS